MTHLDQIAERDGWRCWLCDEPVDPDMSVNDPRGPSVDGRSAAGKSERAGKASKAGKTSKAGKGGTSGNAGGSETGIDSADRLAHRGCNTRKGAVVPVIAWPSRLLVADPAPLFGVAERLTRKGGREVVARCPTRADAEQTAAWLVDRFSRLAPELDAVATIDVGGGQFLVALSAPHRR